MAAVGIDVDNCMLPTARAVVDVENKRNWKWFTELLIVQERIVHVENRNLHVLIKSLVCLLRILTYMDEIAPP